ncbi:hypothetical protein RHSIM_Rhsim06G0216700 [Rhododendron simsii]|uniref:Uncharacterized protein n=1 Tax=Rhododendron simsii TaxID=118357 RepID=A0A834GSP4_RHOSS|nr:hypothetical protein RHSIM_Rhsim06G0216700 [Rhododendron simsii]
MQWAGEDWGSLAPETHFSGDKTREKFYKKATDMKEEIRLLVANGKKAAAERTTQVKIKITKKQLGELLGRMDSVKGLAVEEVVALLMRGDQFDQTHQRSLRPALKSIPEVFVTFS